MLAPETWLRVNSVIVRAGTWTIMECSRDNSLFINIIIVVSVGIGYPLVLNLPVSDNSRYLVKEPDLVTTDSAQLR